MNKIKIPLSLLLILLITVLSLGGCEQDAPHPEDEIISFILESDPLTLDPQIADDYSSAMLIANLFEGLVRCDADGNISPGIAESWDVSSNGLEYVFHLAENTKWSNGDAVTADDFIFGITRALSPETGAENISSLFPIKNASQYYNNKAPSSELGLKAIDEHTLKITLEYPTDGILPALSEAAAMPCSEAFFNSAKGKYGKDADLIITNGPFCIRESYGWDHDKYIYIRRSENYKGANPAVPLGVNFTISSRPSDPIAAINSGEVDLCEIYGNHLADAEESGLSVTATSNTLWGICFNTDIPAFKNAKLRVSLLGSLSRSSLLSDAPSSYVRTTQLIGSSVMFAGTNYRDAVGDFTLEKEEKPQAMFGKAVEELKDNGIELKNSYTVICLDDDTASGIATSVIESWNNVSSCYFNKLTLSRSELEDRIRTGDYEIAIAPLNTAIYSPMEFLSKFVTDSPENYIHLNYPAYNDFIAEALKESGNDSIEALGKAESYLINYGYLYPLFCESRYFASKSTLSGAVFGTNGEAIDFTKTVKEG